MQHNKLLVFDIETVPDSRYKDTKEFPPPAFHQIVAIAFLEADLIRDGATETYVICDLRAGGEADYSERNLLQGFLRYLENLQPRLVSYNGRSFDIPVVKYRAMAYHLAAPLLYHPDYSYRYNVDSHCDLLELLSDFGASTRMRLADVCAILDLPAKLGMGGADVRRLFRSGALGSIRNYCEIDVVSTYLVYLRTALNRGVMTTDGFDRTVFDLKKYLEDNKNLHPHFADFLEEWQRLSSITAAGR